jgi:hypothetical protein
MKHIKFAAEVVGLALGLVILCAGVFGGIAIAGHVQYLTGSGLLSIVVWILCFAIGLFLGLTYVSWFTDKVL